MFRLIGLLLVVVALAVTAGSSSRTTGRVHESNTVSIRDLVVGDRVANLLVEWLSFAHPEGDLVFFGITFSGRVTLSGDYKFVINTYADSPVVTFVLDEASRRKVPHISEDTRGETSYFYLAPHAAFGTVGSQGTATIIIDKLSLPHRYTGEWNTARLVRVVQKR